jgi:ferredoxin-NADP reductase
VVETRRATTLVLDVPGWPGHLAGQHVDVRLTAEDGYQAQRSYSIASPPKAPRLALTVERLEGGEVSPWLAGEARPGDRFELRGPIGGYFTWSVAMSRPLMLVGGGSGVVPLMAILRHRDRRNPRAPALLLYSSRSLEDVIYRQELGAMARRDHDLRVVNTLTRKQPEGWMGRRRRIDKEMLAEACFPPEQHLKIFVCEPTSFVEIASSVLVELGHDPLTIKTERFGPSGGQAMTENGSDLVLDGNAAAGLLQEIFVLEITTAQIQCEACGSTTAVGSLRLYAAPMGAVLSCIRCDGILMRAVRTPHGRWLEMTGARYLRF